jgi:hypothetical protein
VHVGQVAFAQMVVHNNRTAVDVNLHPRREARGLRRDRRFPIVFQKEFEQP